MNRVPENRPNIADSLSKWGVYVEHSFGKWCYKHQFPGQDCIMVSHEDKDKAAGIFFIDFLKGIHYAIRYLYEDGRHDELKEFIEKYRSYGDANIDKTIEIVTKDMKY